MSAFTLAQAIASTGRSRSTLIRAIRSGKISATRDDEGAYRVEPAELHRVFPANGHDEPLTPVNGVPRLAEIMARFEAAEARIAEMQVTARNRDDTIADLRRRLDTATGQLGEALQQMRLLTDQRPNVPPAAPNVAPALHSDPPRSAWRRFLAWRK